MVHMYLSIQVCSCKMSSILCVYFILHNCYFLIYFIQFISFILGTVFLNYIHIALGIHGWFVQTIL